MDQRLKQLHDLTVVGHHVGGQVLTPLGAVVDGVPAALQGTAVVEVADVREPTHRRDVVAHVHALGAGRFERHTSQHSGRVAYGVDLTVTPPSGSHDSAGAGQREERSLRLGGEGVVVG